MASSPVVAFNHNDHYHALLLRQVPDGATDALDVGCGTGVFARRLGGRGIAVDAIDVDQRVIESASTIPSRNVTFRRVDVTTTELSPGGYDFISCLSSLHHVPFDTVTRLRAALKPGGVLAILGCYREEFPRDLPTSLAAVGVNAVARLTHLGRGEAMSAPVAEPSSTLAEIRADAARLLPGHAMRKLLFWRYLLVFKHS